MMIAIKIATAAALLFGTGVLTGVAVVKLGPKVEDSVVTLPVSVPSKMDGLRSTTVESPERPGRSNLIRLAGLRPPGASRVEVLKRLVGELDLTVEQRTKADSLLKESQDRLRKLLKPLQPEASRELKELRLRLADELTPEQRLKFDRLLAERVNNRPKTSLR